VNREPGGLTIAILDRTVTVTVTGGDSYELAIGPLSLLDGPLENANPPSAIHLTNALGMVQDHFDDIIIEAPTIADTPSVVAIGNHAVVLAHVEVGKHALAPGYKLERAAADEVFRTLVAEPIGQRRFNPGIDEHHVASIIGTCCVILGIMRRLDLQELEIADESQAAD